MKIEYTLHIPDWWNQTQTGIIAVGGSMWAAADDEIIEWINVQKKTII